MNSSHRTLISLAVTSLLASPAFAQKMCDEHHDQRFERMATSLELSDQQRSAVKPIIESHMKKIKDIREASRKQIQSEREAMRSELSKILSKDQMQKLDAEREEQKQNRVENMKQKRTEKLSEKPQTE